MLDSATKDGLNIQLSAQKDKRKGAKCRNPSKRSLFPGYSLETAKRFDNKSIAYRNLGLIVIGEGDCSIKPTLPVFEKVPMMQ